MGIARGEELRPAHRPVGAQPIGEPDRGGVPGRRARRDDGIDAATLAQIPAQNRIDETAGTRRIRGLGGFDGGIHDGIGRRPRILDFIQRDGQKRPNQGIE